MKLDGYLEFLSNIIITIIYKVKKLLMIYGNILLQIIMILIKVKLKMAI